MKNLKTYPIESESALNNIKLSLVAPAYNEENRLETFVDDTIKYFDALKIKYEFIIVNDGSKDKTWELIQKITNIKYPKHDIIGVTYGRNWGKGFAVRTVISI